MKILGIETSCDETSVSVVQDGAKVLTLVTATSLEMHKKTRGITPENAARKQVEYMIPVLQEALSNQDVDAVAVTENPGLIGSLVVGVETAKALSFALDKPLHLISHLMGHIYSLWLDKNRKEQPKFPFVVLLVSGGHTELYLVKSHQQINFLGGTRDDAVGECFDKVARSLELGYPGGPAIDAEASKIFNSQFSIYFALRNTRKVCNKNTFKLPKPMITSKDCEFSFSGLKTAVHRITLSKKLNNDEVTQLAFEFRETAVEILISKLLFASKMNQTKNIAVVGGVAANALLRQRLEELRSTYTVFLPHLKYTGDNGAMIASNAYFNNYSK
ncbi:tRNA (adenosine(37)-N6)-threonylcarbamoyltransferase complex transferase subunit TsaD [Candidatus Parcubacteria bacterium]|nr:tRNA (adenosine(37)-N6)-threonylcarbamoyltransferase complex transferase subunit TsaD [Patescibacteria group bacterium]MCG2689050.1 tRNA (adenosine(37)-N6)-threonylcarbamoyltransferase complex transferase subunit TsaD [Candidatus Parcubacteria bacterium]